MYKLICNNISKSKGSLTSFTCPCKKIAQNYEAHASTKTDYNISESDLSNQDQTTDVSEVKNEASNADSDKDMKTVSYNSFFAKEIKARGLKRPLLDVRRTSVSMRTIAYSSTPSKYFYSSLTDQNRGGVSKKKTFKNKEAVDMYKNALEQCNKIKGDRYKMGSIYRNASWFPRPIKPGFSWEARDNETKEEEDDIVLEHQPETSNEISRPKTRRVVHVFQEGRRSVAPINKEIESIGVRKPTNQFKSRKVKITYPTHTVNYKIGFNKPYYLEQLVSNQNEKTTYEDITKARNNAKGVNPADALQAKYKDQPNLALLMKLKTPAENKADLEAAPQDMEEDENVDVEQAQVKYHPTVEKASRLARLAISNKYSQLMSKIFAKNQTKTSSRQETIVEDEMSRDNSEELLQVEELEEPKSEPTMMKHPLVSNKNQEPIDIPLKYPKKIIADKPESFDIDATCIKHKGTASKYSGDYEVDIDRKSQSYNFKDNETPADPDDLTAKSPASEHFEELVAKPELQETPKTPGRVPSPAQSLAEYLKKLKRLRDQTALNRTSIVTPRETDTKDIGERVKIPGETIKTETAKQVEERRNRQAQIVEQMKMEQTLETDIVKERIEEAIEENPVESTLPQKIERITDKLRDTFESLKPENNKKVQENMRELVRRQMMAKKKEKKIVYPVNDTTKLKQMSIKLASPGIETKTVRTMPRSRSAETRTTKNLQNVLNQYKVTRRVVVEAKKKEEIKLDKKDDKSERSRLTVEIRIPPLPDDITSPPKEKKPKKQKHKYELTKVDSLPIIDKGETDINTAMVRAIAKIKEQDERTLQLLEEIAAMRKDKPKILLELVQNDIASSSLHEDALKKMKEANMEDRSKLEMKSKEDETPADKTKTPKKSEELTRRDKLRMKSKEDETPADKTKTPKKSEELTRRDKLRKNAGEMIQAEKKLIAMEKQSKLTKEDNAVRKVKSEGSMEDVLEESKAAANEATRNKIVNDFMRYQETSQKSIKRLEENLAKESTSVAELKTAPPNEAKENREKDSKKKLSTKENNLHKEESDGLPASKIKYPSSMIKKSIQREAYTKLKQKSEKTVKPVAEQPIIEFGYKKREKDREIEEKKFQSQLEENVVKDDANAQEAKLDKLEAKEEKTGKDAIVVTKSSPRKEVLKEVTDVLPVKKLKHPATIMEKTITAHPRSEQTGSIIVKLAADQPIAKESRTAPIIATAPAAKLDKSRTKEEKTEKEAGTNEKRTNNRPIIRHERPEPIKDKSKKDKPKTKKDMILPPKTYSKPKTTSPIPDGLLRGSKLIDSLALEYMSKCKSLAEIFEQQKYEMLEEINKTLESKSDTDLLKESLPKKEITAYSSKEPQKAVVKAEKKLEAKKDVKKTNIKSINDDKRSKKKPEQMLPVETKKIDKQLIPVPTRSKELMKISTLSYDTRKPSINLKNISDTYDIPTDRDHKEMAKSIANHRKLKKIVQKLNNASESMVPSKKPKPNQLKTRGSYIKETIQRTNKKKRDAVLKHIASKFILSSKETKVEKTEERETIAKNSPRITQDVPIQSYKETQTVKKGEEKDGEEETPTVVKIASSTYKEAQQDLALKETNSAGTVTTAPKDPSHSRNESPRVIENVSATAYKEAPKVERSEESDGAVKDAKRTQPKDLQRNKEETLKVVKIESKTYKEAVDLVLKKANSANTITSSPKDSRPTETESPTVLEKVPSEAEEAMKVEEQVIAKDLDVKEEDKESRLLNLTYFGPKDEEQPKTADKQTIEETNNEEKDRKQTVLDLKYRESIESSGKTLPIMKELYGDGPQNIRNATKQVASSKSLSELSILKKIYSDEPLDIGEDKTSDAPKEMDIKNERRSQSVLNFIYGKAEQMKVDANESPKHVYNKMSILSQIYAEDESKNEVKYENKPSILQQIYAKDEPVMINKKAELAKEDETKKSATGVDKIEDVAPQTIKEEEKESSLAAEEKKEVPVLNLMKAGDMQIASDKKEDKQLAADEKHQSLDKKEDKQLAIDKEHRSLKPLAVSKTQAKSKEASKTVEQWAKDLAEITAKMTAALETSAVINTNEKKDLLQNAEKNKQRAKSFLSAEKKVASPRKEEVSTRIIEESRKAAVTTSPKKEEKRQTKNTLPQPQLVNRITRKPAEDAKAWQKVEAVVKLTEDENKIAKMPRKANGVMKLTQADQKEVTKTRTVNKALQLMDAAEPQQKALVKLNQPPQNSIEHKPSRMSQSLQRYQEKRKDTRQSKSELRKNEESKTAKKIETLSFSKTSTEAVRKSNNRVTSRKSLHELKKEEKSKKRLQVLEKVEEKQAGISLHEIQTEKPKTSLQETAKEEKKLKASLQKIHEEEDKSKLSHNEVEKEKAAKATKEEPIPSHIDNRLESRRNIQDLRRKIRDEKRQAELMAKAGKNHTVIIQLTRDLSIMPLTPTKTRAKPLEGSPETITTDTERIRKLNPEKCMPDEAAIDRLVKEASCCQLKESANELKRIRSHLKDDRIRETKSETYLPKNQDSYQKYFLFRQLEAEFSKCLSQEGNIMNLEISECEKRWNQKLEGEVGSLASSSNKPDLTSSSLSELHTGLREDEVAACYFKYLSEDLLKTKFSRYPELDRSGAKLEEIEFLKNLAKSQIPTFFNKYLLDDLIQSQLSKYLNVDGFKKKFSDGVDVEETVPINLVKNTRSLPDYSRESGVVEAVVDKKSEGNYPPLTNSLKPCFQSFSNRCDKKHADGSALKAQIREIFRAEEKIAKFNKHLTRKTNGVIKLTLADQKEVTKTRTVNKALQLMDAAEPQQKALVKLTQPPQNISMEHKPSRMSQSLQRYQEKRKDTRQSKSELRKNEESKTAKKIETLNLSKTSTEAVRKSDNRLTSRKSLHELKKEKSKKHLQVLEKVKEKQAEISLHEIQTEKPKTSLQETAKEEEKKFKASLQKIHEDEDKSKLSHNKVEKEKAAKATTEEPIPSHIDNRLESRRNIQDLRRKIRDEKRQAELMAKAGKNHTVIIQLTRDLSIMPLTPTKTRAKPLEGSPETITTDTERIRKLNPEKSMPDEAAINRLEKEASCCQLKESANELKRIRSHLKDGRIRETKSETYLPKNQDSYQKYLLFRQLEAEFSKCLSQEGNIMNLETSECEKRWNQKLEGEVGSLANSSNEPDLTSSSLSELDNDLREDEVAACYCKYLSEDLLKTKFSRYPELDRSGAKLEEIEFLKNLAKSQIPTFFNKYLLDDLVQSELSKYLNVDGFKKKFSDEDDVEETVPINLVKNTRSLPAYSIDSGVVEAVVEKKSEDTFDITRAAPEVFRLHNAERTMKPSSSSYKNDLYFSYHQKSYYDLHLYMSKLRADSKGDSAKKL